MGNKVVHLTTVHHPLDPRIYYKQCHSLQKAGYEVTLIAPQVKDNFYSTEINIVPIKKYKNRFFRMLLSTITAFKYAKSLKADYYHIHDPELLPIGWLLKKKNNIVIYDIHEDYGTSIKQKEYLYKPLRLALARTFNFFEKVITNKMELCLAEKYYKEKYSRGKCILNYPIINTKLMNRQITVKEERNNLIYTGNITIDRGALIHANIPNIDNQSNVHFIGKCTDEIAKKINETAGKRKRQIKIEGIERYVPKEEIDMKYLNDQWLAGLAIFPNTDHYMKKELTKFFEYMTAGIPIICSNFPKWKEFIDKYKCGIVVDPNNFNEIQKAIAYLRENEHDALEMGNNGKKAILEMLNWETEEKKLIKWYKSLV